jgi:hypothetical protein
MVLIVQCYSQCRIGQLDMHMAFVCFFYCKAPLHSPGCVWFLGVISTRRTYLRVSYFVAERARPIQASAVRILALFLIQSHFQGIVLYRGEVHSMGHDNATIARSYGGAATSVIWVAPVFYRRLPGTLAIH